MAKPVNAAVAVLMFCGWVVYLAGVANMTSLCNKVGNGDTLSSDLISSGPDSPDKAFLPLADPWAMPTATAPSAGRKMLADEALFPTHSRALMSVTTDRCGWTYSFEWWTVALGGLATILAILTSIGALSFLSGAVGPLLIVNTALLCVIASDLLPVAGNLNATKTKGQYPNAIFVTSAGIIINLIGNFVFFFVANMESTVSQSMPEAK